MRFLRQSLTGVFLAALTLALLVYAAQIVLSAVETRMSRDSRAPAARERVFAVNVVTAEPQRITPVLQAFGEVQSRRTLEIRATTGGRVVWLDERFVEGGTVRAGDILLRIDPSNAQAALDRVKSDLLDAEAEVRDAERSLELAQDELTAAQAQADLREQALRRQQDLQARGVGTTAAVEVAELAAASARQSVLSRRIAVANVESRADQADTRLERAKIALREAQKDLDDTVITAGFGGTLSEVNLVEGRLVSPNEKLAKIVDQRALEVAFRVSTAQYARLLDDDGALIHAPVKAQLDVSGFDLAAAGTISRDSAGAGAGQSGRLLFARLEAAPGFKPGDFVTVAVEEPPLDNVVQLPASALSAAGTVLVLQGEDRLAELPVTLMRRQGDTVLVRGAELAGREVVTGRTPLLGAGIKVRPLRREPAQPAAETVASADSSTAQQAASAPLDEPEMVELTDERRDQLRQFVKSSPLPKDAKDRVLGLLDQPQVPARLVQRIESRMGG